MSTLTIPQIYTLSLLMRLEYGLGLFAYLEVTVELTWDHWGSGHFGLN